MINKVWYYLKALGIFIIIIGSCYMAYYKYYTPCTPVAFLKEPEHTIQSQIPPKNISELLEKGFTVRIRCFDTGVIFDSGLIRKNITKDGFIDYIGNNCTEIKTYEVGAGNNTNFPIPICYG